MSDVKIAKKKSKNIAARLLRLCVATISIVMLFLILFLSVGLAQMLEEERYDKTLSRTQQDELLVRYVLESNMSSIELIARQLTAARDANNIVEQMDVLSNKLKFSFLRYINGAQVYNQSGTQKTDANDEVMALVNTALPGMTDVFTENETNQQMLAFYAPIYDNANISGVVGYYPLSTLLSDSYFESLSDSACIINEQGDAVIGTLGEGGHSNMLGLLRADETITPDALSGVSDNLKNREDGIISLSGGEVIAYSAIENTSVNWFLAERSMPDVGDGSITDRVVARLITLAAIFVALVLLLGVYMLRMRKKTDAELDTLTGGISYDTFKKQASELIKINSKTAYALMYIDVKNFEYINDHFGYDVSNNTIIFMSKVIKRVITENELYARISADHFILLLKYHDLQDIITRFKTLSAVINSYEELRNLSFNIKIGAGIYQIDRTADYTIHEMVDRAVIARKTINLNAHEDYVVYDEKIRTNFVKVAEIESYMETSLKEGDFKMYLQPKYNIARNSIDGAEALVRWEHPKRGVILPDDFVPIFEQNGFITQVDRDIFEQACKLIERLLGEGKRLVTISVNVSRVNAIQPNFLEYYIGTKRKYKIPDGLIELEFTESFALNSYETLVNIINTLKANGISCSIDDFGAGYSSFQALKELQMDVLKLDKMFLTKGSHPERDQILLSAIIKLAGDFGMKVIQEGVETPEDLDRMRRLGCESIQGYLYSRPLTEQDFVVFLANAFEGIPLETLRRYYNDANYYPRMPSTVDLGLKRDAVTDD